MTVSEIRDKVAVDQRWLERAIVAIDDRQTSDEHDADETLHRNARGWNSADANLGSYLARYIRSSTRPLGQRLSGDFIAKARRIIRKYCGQLARIVEEKAAA